MAKICCAYSTASPGLKTQAGTTINGSLIVPILLGATSTCHPRAKPLAPSVVTRGPSDDGWRIGWVENGPYYYPADPGNSIDAPDVAPNWIDRVTWIIGHGDLEMEMVAACTANVVLYADDPAGLHEVAYPDPRVSCGVICDVRILRPLAVRMLDPYVVIVSAFSVDRVSILNEAYPACRRSSDAIRLIAPGPTHINPIWRVVGIGVIRN